MRQRIRSDETTADVLDYITPTFNWDLVGQPPQYVTLPYDASSVFEAMEDLEVQDFHKRKNNGEIFVNPMLQVLSWTEDKPGTYSREAIRTSDGEAYYLGRYFNPAVPESIGNPWSMTDAERDTYFQRWDTDRAQAVAKAWANIDESELLAYATVGELPETVKWIYSLYRRFLSVMRKFSAKRIKLELKRATRSYDMKDVDVLANFWLEMRYAVRPLMFEMEQVINVLNSDMKNPERGTARGFNMTSSETIVDEAYDHSDWGRVERKGVIRESSKYRAGVIYNIDLEDTSWTQLLALDQPLATIWELTTLSFLIDWFLNIGTLISCWTPNVGLTPLASWVVETHTYSWDIAEFGDFTSWTYPGWTFSGYEKSPGYTKGSITVKRRSLDPARPLTPSVKVNLDWAKTLDIAAIARGFFRSMK